MPRKWKVEDLEKAVAESKNRTQVLRRLGLCITGGNNATIRGWIAKLGIDTSHFETQSEIAHRTIKKDPVPLAQVLVEKSTYSRSHLKRRLLKEGLIREECYLCGQGPAWMGKKMPLILDHINGTRDDSRLENLRMVCPNCNATLDTFCGRKAWKPDGRLGGKALPKQRKVARPPYKQLATETTELGFCATGRKYGVSDNAVRKWMHCYERHGI